MLLTEEGHDSGIVCVTSGDSMPVVVESCGSCPTFVALRTLRLHIDDGGPFVDFFDRVEIAAAGTGATGLNILPVVFCGDDRIPERPGPALFRPYRIDGAAARLRVEVHAVSIGVFVK